MELKKGDIIELFSNKKKYLILTEPTVKYSSKFPIKATIINLDDLSNLKKGDKRARKVYEAGLKETGYKIIGKGSKSDIDLGNDVKQDILAKTEEYSKKNYSQIDYDFENRGHFFLAQNGDKINQGDLVSVRFKNGNFNGVVKQIAGTKTGEIMIVFKGRQKAKGIKPERILRKI